MHFRVQWLLKDFDIFGKKGGVKISILRLTVTGLQESMADVLILIPAARGLCHFLRSQKEKVASDLDLRIV